MNLKRWEDEVATILKGRDEKVTTQIEHHEGHKIRRWTQCEEGDGNLQAKLLAGREKGNHDQIQEEGHQEGHEDVEALGHEGCGEKGLLELLSRWLRRRHVGSRSGGARARGGSNGANPRRCIEEGLRPNRHRPSWPLRTYHLLVGSDGHQGLASGSLLYPPPPRLTLGGIGHTDDSEVMGMIISLAGLFGSRGGLDPQVLLEERRDFVVTADAILELEDVVPLILKHEIVDLLANPPKMLDEVAGLLLDDTRVVFSLND